MLNEDESTKGRTGNLLLNRVAHYKVTQGSSTLHKEFTKTVNRYTRSVSKVAPITTIPFSAIDDIVETDFQRAVKKFGPSVISIYVFNSEPSYAPYYYSNSGTSGECSGSIQAGTVS